MPVAVDPHAAAADGRSRRAGRTSRSPTSWRPRTAASPDYVGAFAVTAGHRARRARAPSSRRQHDDYTAILAKALADRLAEAFAERLHERVRPGVLGLRARTSRSTTTALIKEQYQGIRPAPGYPACPDHTEKRTLFDLLDAEARAGITLTESFAMLPAAAVSGYYFWRPEAQYFGVGKIGRDQVEDYARRKGMDVADGRALARAEPGLRRDD